MIDTANEIAKAIRAVGPKDREELLINFLASAAAGLTIVVGPRETAEILYRFADAAVDEIN